MLINTKPKIFDVDLCGLLTIAAVVLLAWLLLIKPLNKRINTEAHNQQKILQNSQSSQQEMQKLREKLRERQKLTNNLYKIRNIIRGNTGMAHLIVSLSHIVKRNHLIIDEITPQTTDINQHFRKSVVSVSLRGSFTNIAKLLNDLRSKLQYVRINNLEILRSNKNQMPLNQSSSLCDINMELDVYSPKLYLAENGSSDKK